MSAPTTENLHYILPRIIRIRDAPFYLGMDKNRFNAEVRPSLTELKIGTQGIAFDRLELDAWVDELKTKTGKPGKKLLEKETWQRKSQASSKGATVGTSTKSSKADAFAKALAQATSKRRKHS